MHDLNTINRLNREATDTARAKDLAASGRYVLIRKSGMHVVGVEDYGTADERQAYADAWNATSPACHSETVNPPARTAIA